MHHFVGHPKIWKNIGINGNLIASHIYNTLHFELNQEFQFRSNSTYLSRLFSYYDMQGTVSWGEALFFAFGIIFCSAFNIMVQHPFMMGVMHMGMKMRVGVCSLIYRKVYRVIQTLSHDGSPSFRKSKRRVRDKDEPFGEDHIRSDSLSSASRTSERSIHMK